MTENRRIQRHIGTISSVEPGQIVIEEIADADLGITLLGYQNENGDEFKTLCKNENAFIVDLRLTGTSTTGTAGLLQHDTNGDVTGGLMTVAEFNTYLSDGPIVGGLEYVGVSGEAQLTDYVVFANSSYITFDQTDNTITPSLGAHATTHVDGGSDEIDVGGLSGLLADGQVAGYLYAETYPTDLSTPPTNDQALTWDGSSWVASTVVGTITGFTEGQVAVGNVSGTLSGSADLVFASGDLFVNGSITLDTDHIAGITSLTFIESGAASGDKRMAWNNVYDEMRLGLSADVSLSLGVNHMSPKVLNETASVLVKGEVVSVVGSDGDNMSVAVSDNTDGRSDVVVGLSAETITPASNGYVVTKGPLRDVDTAAFSANEKVWVGVNGALTATQPTAPNASTGIGRVIGSGAVTGSLFVDIDRVPYLSFLSDVHAREQTHTEGDVLRWDATNDRWDLGAAVSSVSVDGFATEKTGAVTFYEGANILIDEAPTGWIISALVADIVYTATNYSIVSSRGTYISGGITDTETVNTTGIVIQEVSGAPGMLVQFTIADVTTSFDRIRAHVQYDPNTTHSVHVLLYNNDTLVWDEFTEFGAAVGYQTIDIPVDDSAPYISGTNEVAYSFDHDDNGNTSHQITFDYIALVKTGGGSGGGSLQDAYDLGRSIAANSGHVGISTGSGADNTALAVSALTAAGTSDVIQIYNSSSGNSVYLSGTIGTDDFSGDGHIIESNGSTNYKASFGTYGTTHIHQRVYTIEGNSPEVEIAAVGAGTIAGYESSLYLNSALSGGHADLTTTGTISLSSGSTLSLNPSNDDILCGSSAFRYVRNTTHNATTGATFTTDTVDIDFEDGYQIMKVSLTAACTAVTVSSDPHGAGSFTLLVDASGAARAFGGFPAGWKWDGNYNLSTGSTNIPLNTSGKLSVTYDGASYRGQFVHEVS